MRRLLAIPLIALFVLVLAPAAGAHALLRASDPADGTVLDDAPSRVAITFTERPEPDLSEIRVLDADGRSFHVGGPEADPDDPLTLVVGVEGLGEGVYTVAWRAFSAVDGHITGGAFAFGIDVDPEEVVVAEDIEAQEPPIAPAEVAGRWILYVGLAALVGGTWVGSFAFRTPPDGVRRLVWVGVAVAAGGLVVLGASQHAAAGASVSRFLSTDIGRALLARTGALVVVLAALVVAQFGRGLVERGALGVAGAAAATVMFVHASAGHAAAGDLVPLNVAVQWVHVLAAGVWVGGLAALLVGIRGAPDAQKTSAVRRFSKMAAIALALVVGTGVGRAVRELASVSQLVETPYGRVILAKSILLGGLVLLAALNRYRHVPRVADSLAGLRRVSKGELAVAAMILAAAAVLASLTPARYVVEAAERERIAAAGTDFARSVEVTFEAEPGTPGPNAFAVHLTDPETGDPVPAERVAARFRLPGALDIPERSLAFERVTEGLWEARGSELGVPGVWRVVVVVERGARSVEVPLEVGTRCVSRAQPGLPDGPTLHTIDLGDGRSVLAFLEPGEAGGNNAHFTFFDETGDEMPVTDVELSAFEPEHGIVEMEVQTVSAGHYIGHGMLESGWWRLEVTVTDVRTERIVACFEDEVR